ncbi:MAG: response regulator transcription factor [Lachnospiraceae bacterium]
MSVITIMITDDHAMMREGIKQLLEFEGDMKVIAEASNGNECLKILKKVTPDVLLLDINMPEKNGIEVLEELKKKGSSTKVLILTVHNEIDYLVKAVDIGVDGYILKDSGSNELRKAIQSVIKDEIFIQPSLIPLLNARLIKRDKDIDKMEALTKREREVLIQVANGMFNKEIAESLMISERTVKNHISSIFKKIEVLDRTQAALFAIRNNMIRIF